MAQLKHELRQSHISMPSCQLMDSYWFALSLVCTQQMLLFFFKFEGFFLRFYLFIHRDKERQRHRQREKQASCREPDVGLDPRSPGSHPGLQVAAKPTVPPGLPSSNKFSPFFSLSSGTPTIQMFLCLMQSLSSLSLFSFCIMLFFPLFSSFIAFPYIVF